MKVLVATEKPFAAAAVNGIREIVEGAGHELALLEKYTEKEQLLAAIDTLTPREQKVIRLRYGLDDSHPRTLEEVGREFNVTRERIRQIEAKALRKLRAPNRSKGLKGFADGE